MDPITEGIEVMSTSVKIRRAVAALALCLASSAAVAAPPSAAQASWYPASTGAYGVTIRDCFHPVVRQPSTDCRPVAVVPPYTSVRIVCQHSGQNIGGDPVWNYIVWEGGSGRPEGYAADYYINTGYANWIPGVDRCATP